MIARFPGLSIGSVPAPDAVEGAPARPRGQSAAQASALARDRDLVGRFVRNELSAQPTLLFLAAIFTLAALYWTTWQEALGWLVVIIAAKVLLLEVCRRYGACPPRTAEELARWQRVLVAAELASGLAWAAFALFGLSERAFDAPDRAISSHLIVFSCFIIVAAVRMTFAAPLTPVLLAGTVPMAAAVIVRLAGVHDVLHLSLAVMTAGIELYFLVIAQGLRGAALDMVDLRADMDQLITALEEAKRESDEACSRAESASVAKSRFLATMSHELRTPLNAIMGFSEVMSTEMLGPMQNTTYRQYARHIHESGGHLLALINEILDLSRIEAGRHELHETDVRVDAVARECVAMLELKAASKKQTIVELYEPDLPVLRADERAVRQICLNLLSNAVKFTPLDGRISVLVRRTGEGGMALCVRDDGPGIPADEIPKVMEAFGRGSLAQQSAEGGTGLGLTIVHSLAELHGGRFELHTEVGHGTEAVVVFPAARVPSGASATATSLPPRRPARIRSRLPLIAG